jgi:hypothetical protein
VFATELATISGISTSMLTAECRGHTGSVNACPSRPCVKTPMSCVQVVPLGDLNCATYQATYHVNYHAIFHAVDPMHLPT